MNKLYLLLLALVLAAPLGGCAQQVDSLRLLTRPVPLPEEPAFFDEKGGPLPVRGRR